MLYDGVCALCNGAVRRVLRHDRDGLFGFAALQSETGRRLLEAHGRSAEALDTMYVVADYDGSQNQLLARSDAALFLLAELGWTRLARVARWIPRWLRDAAYGLVARTRYRVFGRYAACPLPAPEHRARFVDLA